MGQKYQISSPDGNDNRGPDGCCVQDGVADDVADNVAASTPLKDNDFNDVADVALQDGVYEGTGDETASVEYSLNNKTISSPKRGPIPHHPQAPPGRGHSPLGGPRSRP